MVAKDTATGFEAERCEGLQCPHSLLRYCLLNPSSGLGTGTEQRDECLSIATMGIQGRGFLVTLGVALLKLRIVIWLEAAA